ncbi:MAG: GIY-YIG nuclease family protein [Alkalinema sp. RU_4_3]|nr:GIY-YIG nuclease family protein [Alkalinema sp. RU_4_3]
MEPQTTAIEHQNVPVAHEGLHNFLYSSDDEHSAAAPTAILPETTDAILALDEWCNSIGEAKIAGVYGVYDSDRALQYVNISRNVTLSLRGHQTQLGNDLCAFVRVTPFTFPKREEMTALQTAWIAENGAIPIGNSDPDSLWANTTGQAAINAMTPAERAAYEEKKLKLRKAMADSTLARETPIETTPQAVDSDDWSTIIKSQTQETL